MKGKIFRDKICWVTGASSGIGASLAKALNNEGSYVIISGRNADGLEKMKAECTHPERIGVLAFDMEDTDRLPEFAMKAWSHFNGIDYVFLNAGFAVRDWLLNIEIKMFRKVMEVNFFSAVAIAKSLLPVMIERKHGYFIVTSSLSGKYGIPKLSAYAASKHALHGFFESLRAEYAKDGIRVSMIVPGLINTGITVHSLVGDGSVSGKMQVAVANGMSPEKCAIKMMKAVANQKNEAIIGGQEIYSVWIKRFFPAIWDYLVRNHPLKKMRSLQFQFGKKQYKTQ